MNFQDILKARPLVAAHLKKDFAAFCRSAWPHLHPGAKLSWTTAHDLIAEYMVAVHEKRLTRVIINCPPRFAKSSIVNILFPIWVWLQDPTKAFLCCSYEIDLALNHNLDRRRLMDSKWFRDLFADSFTLAVDRSQAGDFSNTAGGMMQAASTNSKAQGRGGDFIIVDDPLSADAATSETFRNETNSWFVHQLPQRLNNPSQSAIVIVMQRLHQNDPTGFLLSQEDSDWTLLKLPLIAEEDETLTFPISGRTWKRTKGECLDAKRWSSKVVQQRQQNRLVWAGQYQQSPVSAEGNLIRTDDILLFGGRDPKTGAIDPGLPESFERKIISVDCSFKDLSTSDFVCIIVVGIVGSRRYLLHVTNAHLDLTATENEIRNCHATFGGISATLIEDKANGPSVIRHLRDSIAGVIAINPEGGKMSRMMAAAPEFQAHNWIIERNGPWTNQVITQLTLFPVAKHDDIADAVSQCSIWLQSHTHELGLLNYFKQLGTGVRKVVRSVAELLARKPGVTAVGEEKSPIVTRDQAKEYIEGHPPPLCPHPDCKNPCTFLSRDHEDVWHIHCKQCGRVDGKEIVKPIDGNLCWVPGCGLKLVTSGGHLRCQNHGQLPVAGPSLIGATFKDLDRGKWLAKLNGGNHVGRKGGLSALWK
jgi:predicted phage terminase large subunit-like protein